MDSSTKYDAAMLDSLAPQSLEVLLLAVEQALALKHACVATEHLLLGLVGVHTPARDALLASDLDFAKTMKLVKQYSTVPRAKSSFLESLSRLFQKKELPLSHDTETVIEVAKEKTEASGSKIIEPAHLLLAILDLPESSAAQMLMRSGINFGVLAAKLAPPAAEG